MRRATRVMKCSPCLRNSGVAMSYARARSHGVVMRPVLLQRDHEKDGRAREPGNHLLRNTGWRFRLVASVRKTFLALEATPSSGALSRALSARPV